jgi:hypothetical protein
LTGECIDKRAATLFQDEDLDSELALKKLFNVSGFDELVSKVDSFD